MYKRLFMNLIGDVQAMLLDPIYELVFGGKSTASDRVNDVDAGVGVRIAITSPSPAGDAYAIAKVT